MSARPKSTQSEFDEDSLHLKPSVEARAIRLADIKNDQLPSGRPSLGNLDPLGRLGRLDPLVLRPAASMSGVMSMSTLVLVAMGALNAGSAISVT